MFPWLLAIGWLLFIAMGIVVMKVQRREMRTLDQMRARHNATVEAMLARDAARFREMATNYRRPQR